MPGFLLPSSESGGVEPWLFNSEAGLPDSTVTGCCRRRYQVKEATSASIVSPTRVPTTDPTIVGVVEEDDVRFVFVAVEFEVFVAKKRDLSSSEFQSTELFDVLPSWISPVVLMHIERDVDGMEGLLTVSHTNRQSLAEPHRVERWDRSSRSSSARPYQIHPATDSMDRIA